MIRYSLLCAKEHGFDSWFRDSHAFDSLSAAGQVSCPSCGSTGIRKALMAPSVVTARAREAASPSLPAVEPPADPPTQPSPLTDERARQLRAIARELHHRFTANADDVGRAFATEARAIHDGSAPPRSIYGEATRDEVGGLLEDGIPLLPLPPLPDDHH